MNGREDSAEAHSGGQLSVSLCAAGHVHLRMRGENVSFDIPLDSQDAASLAGALLAASADAKAVEDGGSAACH